MVYWFFPATSLSSPVTMLLMSPFASCAKSAPFVPTATWSLQSILPSFLGSTSLWTFLLAPGAECQHHYNIFLATNSPILVTLVIAFITWASVGSCKACRISWPSATIGSRSSMLRRLNVLDLFMIAHCVRWVRIERIHASPQRTPGLWTVI